MNFSRWRAAPPADPGVDLIAMDERAPPAAPGRESVGSHRENRVEVSPRQVAVGPGPADQRVQLILGVFAARRLGDELLRQHVERRVVLHDAIELAGAHRSKQRGALDEVVARHRHQAALRRSRDGVA